MLTDPVQTRDLAAEQPQIARQLREAVPAWREEIFGAMEDAPPGGAVDARPILVGYREFPVALLLARNGEPRGGVRRSSCAPWKFLAAT